MIPVLRCARCRRVMFAAGDVEARPWLTQHYRVAATPTRCDQCPSPVEHRTTAVLASAPAQLDPVPLTPRPGTANRRTTAAGILGVDHGTWVLQAACAGITDPDIFFPESWETPAQALELCAGCPVRISCQTTAVDNREQGVWGGTEEAHRVREDRRARRRTRQQVA